MALGFVEDFFKTKTGAMAAGAVGGSILTFWICSPSDNCKQIAANNDALLARIESLEASRKDKKKGKKKKGGDQDSK